MLQRGREGGRTIRFPGTSLTLAFDLAACCSGLFLTTAGLWGLVNNAAVSGPRGRFEWLKADDFRETNESNLYGLIDLTITLLPLIKQERGRVVNISSLAGRMVLPFAVPYCVSKFAVECLTDAWRFLVFLIYHILRYTIVLQYI